MSMLVSWCTWASSAFRWKFRFWGYLRECCFDTTGICKSCGQEWYTPFQVLSLQDILKKWTEHEYTFLFVHFNFMCYVVYFIARYSQDIDDHRFIVGLRQNILFLTHFSHWNRRIMENIFFTLQRTMLLQNRKWPCLGLQTGKRGSMSKVPSILTSMKLW